MSTTTPLLQTIEADEADVPTPKPAQAAAPVTNPAQAHFASSQTDAESGIAGIFRQSSHPLALFFLWFFRVAAVTTYILSGWFSKNYVLVTVTVVVLLAMDFWNCRNVSGRTLVGLRFWNQVDDDGESYWVFESRDPSRPANAVDSRMFWIALYSFPVVWSVLLILSIVRLSWEFTPIVILALVFNCTNAIGFTYADRDAKSRWASGIAANGWGLGLGGFGGFGGQVLSGVVKSGVGRVFGS